LLVDDQDIVRKLLEDFVESAGYRVIAARSSAEAREQSLAAETIDVVIADLSLPDGDGVTLVRELRQARPSLRALFMSGDPEAEVGGRFIAKPFGLKDFLEALRLAINDDTLPATAVV